MGLFSTYELRNNLISYGRKELRSTKNFLKYISTKFDLFLKINSSGKLMKYYTYKRVLSRDLSFGREDKLSRMYRLNIPHRYFFYERRPTKRLFITPHIFSRKDMARVSLHFSYLGKSYKSLRYF